jgi:hypothetical protein
VTVNLDGEVTHSDAELNLYIHLLYNYALFGTPDKPDTKYDKEYPIPVYDSDTPTEPTIDDPDSVEIEGPGDSQSPGSNGVKPTSGDDLALLGSDSPASDPAAGPTTSILRLSPPVFNSLTSLQIDLNVLADRPGLTPGAHALDAVLVGGAVEVPLAQIDLADYGLAANDNPLGFAGGWVTPTISVPDGALEPATPYHLEFRYRTDPSASGEHVAVALDRLIVQVRQPDLALSTPTGDLADGSLDLGFDTSDPSEGVVALTNSGSEALDVDSLSILGDGFQIFDGPPSDFVLLPGGSLTIDVRAVTPSLPRSAILRVTSDAASGATRDLALVYDPPVLVVTTTADAGPGSLRDALTAANASSHAVQIRFQLAPTDPNFDDDDAALTGGDAAPDVFVITPLTPLPLLANPLGGITIDGRSQAAYGGETNPFGPEVVLDGSAAGGEGLTLLSAHNAILGLNVRRFATGIEIRGGSSNVVAGNYLGTEATGRSAMGNTTGVSLDDAPGNTIGGTAAGARNLISGNSGTGVQVFGAAATGNIIAGNYIGTDASGLLALGNGSGVFLNLAPGTTVGGVAAGTRNVVSGNRGNAISLSQATDAIIQGNYVGVAADGLTKLGNSGFGISVASGSDWATVGGTAAGAGNVVSGNARHGVRFVSSSSGVVQGNDIGTDATGLKPLGNTGVGPLSGIGLSIENSSSILVGGTAPGARNVIAANVTGIVISGTSPPGQFNRVQGNYVGLGADGVTKLGNTGQGISVTGPNNTIGGSEAGAGNVISGNGTNGLAIIAATGNVAQGNLIGTDASGTLARGNGTNGVILRLGATSTLIGGPGAGNTIAFNGGAGVAVTDATTTSNAIRANTIFSNVGLAIDLGNNGPTANDSGDVDAGPNGLQNYPTILAAASGSATRVVGSFAGAAGASLTLDFYAIAAADPSGAAGGRWLGSVDVLTDATGQASFDAVLPSPTVAGEFVTATATAAGGTSELSGLYFATGMQGADLLVGGGSGNDAIVLQVGSVVPVINGVTLGHFDPTGRVVVQGFGGDDTILADPSFSITMLLDGGDGNDTLQGGRGVNTLVGGRGDNTFVGVGGINTIVGGTGNNLLVAGGGQNSFQAPDGLAPLTVTALPASRTYGDPNPAFSASYQGLQGADTPSSLAGLLSIATPATAASEVGSYLLTPSGQTSTRYAILYVTGTLLVTPAHLTVAADPVVKTYGEAVDPASLRGSLTGVRNGDPITAVYSSPGVAAGADVGVYPIAAALSDGGSGRLARDYVVESALDAVGVLTVAPAWLTVAALDQSKVYGQVNPPLTYAVSGFVNGDDSRVLNGNPTLATTAGATSPVGTYPIMISAGTLAARDYTFGLVAGTLAVDKAETATALVSSAASPLYGVDALGLATSVVAVAPGSGTPTGSVDVSDSDGTLLAHIDLATGTATIAPTALAPGIHTLHAAYNGDGNFSPSAATATVRIIAPSGLSGVVFEDLNNDGQVDLGERGIAGVAIRLAGTNDLGRAVDLALATDADGAYVFSNLRPGRYTITETQPAGYTQGINTVGTAGGTVSGDQFAVDLAVDLAAMNYNFGERSSAGQPVQSGQAAGIGFWNNKNGQALIKALNGGVGTQLGDWLATSFPNMYGARAGTSNLAGKSNADVAAFFQSRFILKGDKLDAQVLATALSVYVTDSRLNPTGVGSKYGFLIDGKGLGSATFNVGLNGAAFGVADNATMTVMDLLRAADARAIGGVLYNGDAVKRTDAKNVFAGINEAGGI